MLNFIKANRILLLWVCFYTLNGNPDAALKIDSSISVEFVILIPSYNNESVYRENLDSVVHQLSSKPFEVIYVNDCSTDRTGELVEQYTQECTRSPKIKIIHNSENQGAMKNIYDTVHRHIPDNKVVVLLDGDDSLIGNKVLLKLEKEYKNPSVWMTYGNYKRTNNTEGYAYEVPRKNQEEKTIRSTPYFPLMPLRSFKSVLFKKIAKEDLLYNGKFLDMASDPAYMYPMAEMCAPKDKGGVIHSVFISDFLYLVNSFNPISDRRKDLKKQLNLTNMVKAKKPYEPIDRL